MARAAEMRLESGGRFGTAFYKALVDNNLSLVEFARKVDANYEYMRKVVRGLNTPSKHLLPILCKALHLDHEEMKALVMQDVMEKKYGKKALSSITGHTAPHSAEIEKLLPHLSEAEVTGLLAQMKVMVKQKSKQGARAS